MIIKGIYGWIAALRLRNKLVAEAFYLTGNIEKYGSGFIRIRKSLRDYPEIKFEIKEYCGGVLVTFTQLPRENCSTSRGWQILAGKRKRRCVRALHKHMRRTLP